MTLEPLEPRTLLSSLRPSWRPLSAVTFDSASGITKNATDITSSKLGAWLEFNNVSFASGMSSVQATLALSPHPKNSTVDTLDNPPIIEFHLNSLTGPLIGKLVVQPTGSPTVFNAEAAPIRATKGTHNLYLLFKGSSTLDALRSVRFSTTPLIRIMPLGDSITEGQGPHLSYRYWLWQDLRKAGYLVDFVGSMTGPKPGTGDPPYWNFDQNNEGHWGYTTSDILANVKTYAAYKPDVVLIHLGTNDLMIHRPIDQPIQNLSQIIDAFRAANPNVKIVLAQILPTTHVPTVTTQAYNARLVALANAKTTRQSPVLTADQFTGFNPATDTYDGIHPLPLAEQQMASRFLSCLKRLLRQSPSATLPAMDNHKLTTSD